MRNRIFHCEQRIFLLTSFSRDAFVHCLRLINLWITVNSTHAHSKYYTYIAHIPSDVPSRYGACTRLFLFGTSPLRFILAKGFSMSSILSVSLGLSSFFRSASLFNAIALKTKRAHSDLYILWIYLEQNTTDNEYLKIVPFNSFEV